MWSALPSAAESGPTDAKAQKTYAEAQELLKQHKYVWALDGFKKAAKQDGHCVGCDEQIIDLGVELEDFKAATAAGEHLLSLVHNPKDVAAAHYLLATALLRAGSAKHKDDLLQQSLQEYKAALASDSTLRNAVFGEAMTLAWLNQDDAAKAEFLEYLKVADPGKTESKRALRYSERPELVRARMAPAFQVKTIDGRVVSFDDLAGKVVLIDFWATWCGPCREALPHVREIAKKFAGQPLVVMSISLDKDDAKWRDFVAKNEMTWLQTRDGGFDGKVANLFAVHAIPATFTIDADGVLQDQHVGDASIEGKLKKLVARAQAAQTQTQAHEQAQIHPNGQ